ncbi:MAG: TlpA family protein disulfide reductase [Pirellulales bacterium]
MWRPLIALCGMLVLSYAAKAESPPRGQRGTADPAAVAEFKVIEKEYKAAENAYFREILPKAKTGKERSQVGKERQTKREEFAGRMLDVAARYPDEPVAIDALGWVLGHQTAGKHAKQAEQVERALKALADYVEGDLDNAKLEAVSGAIWRLALIPEQERFLRETLDNNRYRTLRASAGYRLAYLLKLFSHGDTRNPDPAVAAKRAAEAEQVYGRVIEEFGDLKWGRGTVAEYAGPELFELRDLAIGKTVPEIEGEDLDGVTFKLSDYRGKVVLLNFWGDW